MSWYKNCTCSVYKWYDRGGWSVPFLVDQWSWKSFSAPIFGLMTSHLGKVRCSWWAFMGVIYSDSASGSAIYEVVKLHLPRLRLWSLVLVIVGWFVCLHFKGETELTCFSTCVHGGFWFVISWAHLQQRKHCHYFPINVFMEWLVDELVQVGMSTGSVQRN